jgi:predicted membrane-bound mannosyltransferase/DNA-binding beta-propeller fold protein YncE
VTSVIKLDWEKASYFGLIVLAIITRFYDLGARVMSHDESLHTQFSWYLYQGRGFQHTPMMHGPLKFELTAFMYWLFGSNDFTARIVTALMGVAAVGLCWYFRKWLGRAGALCAAVFLLISPYQLYYSRYIRDEPYVMVWALLMALCIFNYMETRQGKYIYGLTAVMSLFYATMESSYIYVAIAFVFIGVFFLYELLTVRWPHEERHYLFWILTLVTLVAAGLGVGIFFFKDRLGMTGTAFAPDTTNPDEAAAVAGGINSLLTTIDIAAWIVAVIAGLAALSIVMWSFGEKARSFASLDLLMALGTFVLPQAAALPVMMMGFSATQYTPPPMLDGMGLFEYLSSVMVSDVGVTAIVTLLFLTASVGFGYIWNWRMFLICAAIHYGIFIPLFTTFFTNGAGLATGLVGSLGYWLEQHGVRRGGQPWYYYLVINLPMYEFLPTLGTLVAAGLGLRAVFRRLHPPLVPAAIEVGASTEGVASLAGERLAAELALQPVPAERPRATFPVLVYIGWWAFMAFVAFSIAGEKMPWLTTHIVLPMILLTGWLTGKLIDGIDWKLFLQYRAWVIAVLLPVVVLALAIAFSQVLGVNPPFQGMALEQLQATMGFISAVVFVLGGVAAIWRLSDPIGLGTLARTAGLGVIGLLALITARTAFIATYVNYDYANEFLVYAHGSRGVRTVMDQVYEISQRVTDSMDLRVAYDDDVAWPMTWYMRDYSNQVYYGNEPTRDQLRDVPVIIAGDNNWGKVEPLLRDEYFQFEYIRMVWPMQDYFPSESATIGQRIVDALSDARMRQALFNIWWDRNYELYNEITGQNLTLASWNPADRMRLYVRRDIASQIWPLGIGAQALPVAQPDPFEAVTQQRTAAAILGGPGQLLSPRGIALAPDGSLYVADAGNARVQHLSSTGEVLATLGLPGDGDMNTIDPVGQLSEPWGLAVDAQGLVYVADTWNHRIQVFDAEGNFVRAWGRFGNDGALDALWGPRGVAVRNDQVFVTDTGNKRIVVYDLVGRPITSIGSGGFLDGQLDEPVGIALDADGAVYVADTWNQRIQKFMLDATDEYVFNQAINVDAWLGQSLENKPYIAVDGQGRIYITDPEAFRVLVFNPDGSPTANWGEQAPDDSAFTVVSGLALDPTGASWIVDSGSNRVLRFDPLP